MKLPSYVLEYLNALEAAGYPAYAVGGCVRDACLGLQPHDYDICTAATPRQTEAVFAGKKLVLAGEKHGTVGVVTAGGVVEITTFRTEGAYRDNRHPDWVKFVDNVESDLARRDYTVNALAYSPTRGFADPFGGQADLQNHILRAVGNPETRFREDALRILRGVRFSAKYGLTPEENTLNAMVSESHLLDSLARERFFDELGKYLLVAKTEDLCRFAPILGAAIPELSPMIGFDQHSPHHAYDLFTHTAHVVAGVPAEPVMRWAALLHDTGKITTFTRDATGRGHFYGHAKESARIADAVLRRLKVPTALREAAVLLIEKHMTRLLPEEKFLRRQAAKLGFPFLYELLTLQKADMGSKGTGEDDGSAIFAQTEEMLHKLEAEHLCLSLKDLAVNGSDLMALGFSGRAIGTCLNALLGEVLEQRLPNERQALLAFAEKSILARRTDKQII